MATQAIIQLESGRRRLKAPSRRRGIRRQRGLTARVLTVLVWGLVLLDLALMGWMVIASLKTDRELARDPWGLPAEPTWYNYADAWNSGQFGAGFINSVLLVAGSGIGALILAAPAAYALARLKVRGARMVAVGFAAGLGIPAQAMFIPLFVMFQQAGLINSIWGLMLIYIASSLPFGVFFLTAFFRSVPPELEEAAVLDGASPFRTFWQVMLPMARSGLITVFVLQAISHWGETLFALVMLQTETTLSLSMYNFAFAIQYTGARYAVLFAGIVVVILPILITFLALQRRIIEGVGSGMGK